jgi:hypothetical protein
VTVIRELCRILSKREAAVGLLVRALSAILSMDGDAARHLRPAGARVSPQLRDALREPTLLLDLERGALATSGDSRRYVVKDGRIACDHGVVARQPCQGIPGRSGRALLGIAVTETLEVYLERDQTMDAS